MQLFVNTSNGTAETEGLVSALLVFVVIQRVPMHPKELTHHDEQMIALRNARRLMAKTKAEMRFGTAFNRRVPSSINYNLRIDDLELVYCDKDSRWMAPWRVVDIKDKSKFIDCNCQVIKMSMNRCKPYHTTVEGRSLNYDNQHHSKAATQKNEKIFQKHIHGGDGFWAFNDLMPIILSTFMVKTFSQTDPRANIKNFTHAKATEIEKLFNRKVWEIAHKKKKTFPRLPTSLEADSF